MNRAIPAAAIGALLLASLSGCFLLPQAPEPKPESSETEDADESDGFGAIGDCWDTNHTDMAEWSSWEGDGPVDCDEDHHAYTYYVGELEADVDEAWEDGGISAELSTAVSDQCEPHLEELGIPDSAARAGGYFFVAPEDDWEDGDHRIRCDVAVSALDSDWNDPELEELPADIDDLVDDIDDNALSYELCVIGDGYGPFDSNEAYYADCGGEYFWRYAGVVEYPSEPSDAVPSDDALYAFADTECAALGLRDDESVLPYVPSVDGWDAGYRSITCWTTVIEEESAPV